MHKESSPVWHVLREQATHWVIGGILLALTGFAPEEWLAHAVHGLHIPEGALHLWAAGIDPRIVAVVAGMAFIGFGMLRQRRATAFVPAAASPGALTGPSERPLVDFVHPALPVDASPPGSADQALPLPGKPSIAVLPFDNLSGDPAQEYFSDGVAEDIITELSRGRALFVIARNSSFTYRGRSMDVKQIARELGVRYVLEGSVRREGERIRVTAQLIDADSGAHIWAERYDRDQQSVFAIQDEITQAVATAIRPAVADAEMHRAMRRSPTSLGAWELYQQGMWHSAKHDAAETDEARRLFERAIERDPMFVAAYVGLSLTCFLAGSQHQTIPLDEATRLASMHARKAVELDPGDADAQAVLAATIFWQGDMDNALVIARQALSINPNCAQAHWLMGAVLMFTGRMAEGRQALGVFERLSPRDAGIATAHRQIAMSYYFERDYERCVEAARRLLSTHPYYAWTHRWLAAALGQLGRTGEARAALEKSIAVSPREFDIYVRNRPPWFQPADHEHMLDGLRKAGWEG